MAHEYVSKGKREDVLYIKNGTASRLIAKEDMLSGVFTIKVEEWPSIAVDRGDGWEDEDEYSSGFIRLNRNDVAALIHRLDLYLKESFDCDRLDMHPKCKEQCDNCKTIYPPLSI